ncbi:MAG TPA: hypothetical protein VLA29_03875 [Acidimicrobiia bacterium]|nr:hypothetical protein [Acidimicrobiia bacterium]
MALEIPIAGAILTIPPDIDPLVVEADPDGERARCFKNVARHVFRFVQEINWTSSGRAVTVAVVGESRSAATVTVNVGVLLAPLLDVGVIAGSAIDEITGMLGHPKTEADSFAGDLVSPRDRMWIVPGSAFSNDEVMSRFDLAIGPVGGSAIANGIDLALVVVRHGDGISTISRDDPMTELAAVLVDAPSADHAVTITMG